MEGIHVLLFMTVSWLFGALIAMARTFMVPIRSWSCASYVYLKPVLWSVGGSVVSAGLVRKFSGESTVPFTTTDVVVAGQMPGIAHWSMVSIRDSNASWHKLHLSDVFGGPVPAFQPSKKHFKAWWYCEIV